MNIEKYYKWANIIGIPTALVLIGAGGFPWWIPLVLVLGPTAVFVVAVVAALIWSQYLVNKAE